MRIVLTAAFVAGSLVGAARSQELDSGGRPWPDKAASEKPGKPVHAKPATKGGPARARAGGATPPSSPAFAPPGADDCATPEAISGSGPFGFDNSAATTGSQGQSESACLAFGSTAVVKDVWFAWTSGFTGNAELLSCGHSVDTKIAVYAGASCPSGAALACNDDGCGTAGFQSRLVFPVSLGSTYVVQVGLYPFTTQGGAGTFTIAQVTPPPNDACSTPTPISGYGTFAFDTTSATTGPDGQGEALCDAFGSTALARDVWFRWFSPVAGPVVLSTCGVPLDTKVAVYPGQLCRSAPAIACNDDSCGFQSRLGWTANQTQFYTIQIGHYPFGATGGAGTFSISPAPPNDECSAAATIAGTGTFAFDSSLASTSAQGQGESACLAYGSTAVANDLWYSWVAPFTGSASWSTCTSAVDTKLAVYAGNGCPAGPALACSDDSCGAGGSQTQVIWPVTAGLPYLLQLGTSPLGGATGGAGSFQLQQVVAATGDDCAAPTAISGAGPHAFDNTFATTGAEGQSSPGCQFFGSTAIANDVWFSWTAATSGTHVLSLCAGAAFDTKIAVYFGAGCPAGPALACNDDDCGLRSELCFDAGAGETYAIQIGLYPGGGASGGAGTFTITAQPVGTTNDSCSAPQAISGLGPHAYDNTTATASCEGQSNASCFSFGSSGIDADLWFVWTPPATGRYQVSFCGLATSNDTKVAVYGGAGCPGGAPLACDDDGCGVLGGESQTCFEVVGGHSYTIQVGSFPGSTPGPGAFQFQPVASLPPCQHDNGTSENSLGLSGGGAMGWIQRFGAPGQTSVVSAVRSACGSAAFPGNAPAPGTPVVAALWDDPNDDGNPADGVLLAQVSGTLTNVDNDVLDAYAFPAPIDVSGIYFLGLVVQHASGELPAPLDQDACPMASNQRAWAVGATSGSFNYASLAANDLPPTELDSIGLGGVWLLRGDCGIYAGTAYCFGDGTGTACPCGNSGAAGHGCASSTNAAGALLRAVGNPVVSADTLTLLGSGMPFTATCLYFQGTTQTAALFGDGLRCTGGAIVRLGTKVNSGGVSQYPAAGDPSIVARCAGYAPPQPISPGQTRNYQVWYRNAAAFCTAATFNLSNGLSIFWQ